MRRQPVREPVLPAKAVPVIPDWHRNAACGGMDTNRFFPDGRDIMRITAAKAVCQGCLVRSECGSDGRDMSYGIWGGRTEDERRLDRMR